MSEKNDFEMKNPFSARTSEDERKLNEEVIRELFSDYDPADLTNRVILNGLVNRAAMKIRRNTEPRKEDSETIQNLTNEIVRQKIMIDQLKEECIEINGHFTEAKKTIFDLKDEITLILAGPVPGENQYVITVPPIIFNNG